jgi:DNA polymerase-1
MTRLYNGVRLLGSGPSVANISRIDSGAMPMILSMAKTGLQVDLDHFAKMETSLTEDMDRITEEVHTLTGHYINLDSGDQVSDLLFKKLGLKQARFKLTRSGDRESVEDEVLTAIQHDHPVVPLILSYKEYSKLQGTYVRPMPKLARRCEGDVWRMFPNLSNTRVPSGRLSCKQPNLLAMPTRTDRGREIRRGFITKPGWIIVSVDESQIEVRLAAHSSGDKALIRVYENEEDIYSDFAITAFKLKDDRYLDETGWHYPSVHRMNHRYPAKTCILASIYDVSAKGLLEQMPPGYGWTEDKCQDLINAFYMKYPGVLEDRRRYHRIARRLGYCYDMWGRILHVAAVRSVHPWVVGAALREVGNFPYQSGAQGTIKLTMAAVWDDLEQSNMLDVVHPLLQVHDELLFECREDVADELIEATKYRFETCAPLRVPLKASGAKAENWGSLEK